MRFATFLGRLKSAPRRDRGGRPNKSRRPLRARLETLEDRTVPAPLILSTPGTEPFVAVDPNNASHVVVGSNRFGARFSTDGGQTFGPPTTPAGYGGDSGLAIDTQGRVFSSYLITDSLNANLLDVAVSNTTFGAESLSSPGAVISRAGVSDDKELIAADHYAGSAFTDNLYVAWRRLNPEFLLYSRSTNHGAELTRPCRSPPPAAGPGLLRAPTPRWRPITTCTSSTGTAAMPAATRGRSACESRPTAGSPSRPTCSSPAPAGRRGRTPPVWITTPVWRATSCPIRPFAGTPGPRSTWKPTPRPGFLYAVWSTDPDGTTAGDAADAMFARSTDGGLTWERRSSSTTTAAR